MSAPNRPKLGDEMPVSLLDRRRLRVVRVDPATGKVECLYCALAPERLDACNFKGEHRFHCSKLPRHHCAVFVDDIPVLTMKGILS